MRVGRGGEFGRRLPLSKIEKNGSPSTNRTILKKHRTIRLDLRSVAWAGCFLNSGVSQLDDYRNSLDDWLTIL